jgi:type VI secretion system protein ImpJ
MRLLSRVVWFEGMHLGPHQFQAQNRYFEDSIEFALSSVSFRGFGFTGCKLDPEALINGSVSLVHARGIFPDGLPFHIPQADAAPPVRQIADLFPPTADQLTILLGIPERREAGPNCAITPNGNRVRYHAEIRNQHDECTGTDERPVQIGRKNVQLLLETENAGGWVTMPVARIRRDGAGHFIYDPDFIPPCLQISASEPLMLLLRRLLEILDNKSRALSRSAVAGASPANFSSRDMANFWLAHSVNSALAPLRHLWISKRGHPEELFVELSRLAGALCTFALDSHPSMLPAYDHLALGECLDALDRHIRAHLELIVPTNCVSIPLRKIDRYFYEGDVQDSRCFGRSQWILGVRAAIGEAELIARAPQLVKICSSKFVGELVRRAIAGLTLTHVPVPPPAISANVETQYFGVSKDAPFWNHIVQTKQVGIYAPGDLPDAELELLVVLEN